MTSVSDFTIQEATISGIHAAFRAGGLTARQLVQGYLDRIAAYDKTGPAINAVISLNPDALDEADRLDIAFGSSGFVGPLHGIPVILKDQADIAGMTTTLGSVLFEDHIAKRDCFVAAALKKAGAILIGKATLGELGGGDTHGSLFGSTRNVYDLERTAGGSSGGSAAAVSANFATVAVGQEGFASIRRPAAWNGIVGMRPTAGLVSRDGAYGCWPTVNGSLGPMARNVADLATLLDSMVGYDPNDPLTAYGVGHLPKSFCDGLGADALRGARIGILREPMGFATDPDADDFREIDGIFSHAVEILREAGAEVVDPVVIPDLAALLSRRARSAEDDEAAFRAYVGGGRSPRYTTRKDVSESPLFGKVVKQARDRWLTEDSAQAHYAYMQARETLMTRLLGVMADNRLDAIVHKAVEHQPTLIKDGVNPPYLDQKGAPHINTFLVFVPSIVVPAGYTKSGLPAGITFLGRPYDDARMVRFSYAFEAATRHRRPPAATP